MKAPKTLTVNYKLLGKQTMKIEPSFHIDLMLEDKWNLEPHVFGTNTKGEFLPPINCQLESNAEYMRLSRKMAPELKKFKGNPKQIYTNNDRHAWFVIDVKDVNGKRWKSIAGWTRTHLSFDDNGNPCADVSVCRPIAMRAEHPFEVDHFQIKVPIQEFVDVEATLLKNDGILPNDNPDVIK